MAKGTQARPHVILTVAIVLIVVALAAVTIIFGRIDQITDAEDDLGNIHALILLEDDAELVSAQFVILNVNTKRAALLDIPPYLGVIVDRNDDLDRIDRLIAGNNFSEYVEEIEAFTEHEVDFYLRFGVEEFTAFIDLLEGVRLFIISSPSDEQVLPSGDVVLDGDKTGEYIALYREEADSRMQIEGLQELIRRTLITISNKRDYLGNADVLRYAHRIIDTNLRRQELRTLLTDIMHGVGEDGVQTWYTQGDVRSVLVGERRESLLFPDLDGRWIADTVAQIETQLVNRRATGSGYENVRLQILNGTETSGLARRTKLLYEQFGYSEIDIDNYQAQDVSTTKIVNYGATPTMAREVAAVINVAAENIAAPDASDSGDGDYELVLIIGQDFDGVKVGE